MRIKRWGAAAAAAALIAAGSVPAMATSGAGLAFHDGDGIHVVSIKQFDARDYNVSVMTAALERPVDVRILVPAGYGANPAERYPVLYLFHGTSGRASDWIDMGSAVQATAGLPLITVMPDAGFNGDGGGWFTNWVDTKTALGPSQWETFHINDLIPWVDANLRTIASRAGRAIAGLSQGGFGSTTYAARHPDLFLSAASFSGAPDIDYNPVVAAGATAVIDATEIGLDQVEPDAMFGDRVTDEINWQGHDPADLVTNLGGMSLWLFTATGLPGPYDPKLPSPAAMGIEFATHESTEGFVARAAQQHVPVHLVDYTYGTHSWPYWARDLRQYLPPLMALFAHPPAAPSTVSYMSVDKEWAQWGWSVALQRTAAQEWSSLTAASRHGFNLSGTGVATVVTPAFYRAGQAVSVSVGGARSVVVRAGADGRLTVVVDLGGISLPAAVIGEPGILPLNGSKQVELH